jgi:hypothetical protein
VIAHPIASHAATRMPVPLRIEIILTPR